MYTNIDLFSKDLILMPINIGNTHWTLIAMDIKQKKVSYYDSLRGNGQVYLDNAIAFLRESAAARNVPFDASDWVSDGYAAEAFPAQPNSFDCGIYVLMVADMLTARMSVSLLSLEVMAKARVHISIGLWEKVAPDLTACAPYIYAPALTAAPTLQIQTTLDAVSTSRLPHSGSLLVALPLTEGLEPPPITTGYSALNTCCLTSAAVLRSLVDTVAGDPPLQIATVLRLKPAGGKEIIQHRHRKRVTTPYSKPNVNSGSLVGGPGQAVALLDPAGPLSLADHDTTDQTATSTSVPTDPTSKVPKRKYVKKKKPNARLSCSSPDMTPDSSMHGPAVPEVVESAAILSVKSTLQPIRPVVPAPKRIARATRNLYARHDTRDVNFIPNSKLRRLRQVAPETCRLAIGPSQQYDGGEELYLDQSECPVGTVIAYYDGKYISETEKSLSSSRYIFEIPTGTGDPLYMDAADPDSGYARYADDSFYDGTENAHWVVQGIGTNTRLALIAKKPIKRGMPIRACYGWEYWYQPELFPKALMRKAFEGYLVHGCLDCTASDANPSWTWAFATEVECEDALLYRWNGVRKHELYTAPTDTAQEVAPCPVAPCEMAPAVITANSTTTPLLPIAQRHKRQKRAPMIQDVPDIRTYFGTVTKLPKTTGPKRSRDSLVSTQGDQVSKKQKATEAIKTLTRVPLIPKGAKRKRKEPAVERAELVLSLVHVIPDGSTVAKAPSPLLPAVTIAAALHVSLVIPVLPVSTTACSLARLPSGTSSTSIPLNER